MTWIVTFTGRRVDLAAPRPEDICIEDVAHALGQLARFNGHARTFYSVAQHSVLVSRDVEGRGYDRGAVLWALLHDAHEAYIGDIATPLKDLLREPTRRLEVAAEQFDHAISQALIPAWLWPLESDRVAAKLCDLELLATEKRDLMPPSDPWPVLQGVPALPAPIKPWGPLEAKYIFLNEYRRLTDG